MNYLVHNLFNEFVNWIAEARNLIEKHYASIANYSIADVETTISTFDTKVKNLMIWVIENEDKISNEHALIDNINILFDKIGNLGVWLNNYINNDSNVALIVFRKYKASTPLSTI